MKAAIFYGPRDIRVDDIPDPQVLSGKLDPSAVFTKTIKLSQILDGYEAMDQRKAIKVLIKF